MALGALPLAKQVELAGGRGHPPFTRRQAARIGSDWLICFVSFTMLLLISWSGTQPGGSTTTIIVLLFLAPWGWIVVRQPSTALQSILHNWLLIALPLLSVTSALWSDDPAGSLKAGAQYLVTTFIGIWAACCIKPRVLMSALLSALALPAVLSILHGSYGFNPDTGEYTLIGIFGSKNYFALCITLLLLTAVSVTLDRSQAFTFRVLGVASCLSGGPSPCLCPLSRGSRCLHLGIGDFDDAASYISAHRYVPFHRSHFDAPIHRTRSDCGDDGNDLC